MQFLAGFTDTMGGALFALAAFVVLLTVVVFIHELGHFLVARWCGVKVSTFSIGFGREIFGFYDRQGTRWRVAWIPLGGYVKFMDDDSVASSPDAEKLRNMTPEERAGSFHSKPLWRRAAVVAAGPIANFLLAIVIFSLMFGLLGQRITVPRVDEVVAGMPAEAAGFKVGDVITSIEGRQVESFIDVLRLISTRPGRPTEVTVRRGETSVTMTVTPKATETEHNIGGKLTRGIIGIRNITGPEGYKHKSVGPVEAVWLGVKETEFVLTTTLSYIGDVLTLRQSPDQIGGLPRMADVSGKMAAIGPEAFIHLIALISISVGLINLFPIPVLDGGHLMFYAIEAVRGRPLSEETQELGFRFGFALVLTLMVLVNLNDTHIVAGWFGI